MTPGYNIVFDAMSLDSFLSSTLYNGTMKSYKLEKFLHFQLDTDMCLWPAPAVRARPRRRVLPRKQVVQPDLCQTCHTQDHGGAHHVVPSQYPPDA